MKTLFSEPIIYRSRSEIPLFCKPIPLFLMIWAVMLASLAMHVTYNSYPDISLGVFVFFLSFASLVAGYLTARTFATYRVPRPAVEVAYRVDLTLLRRMTAVLASIAAGIVLANFLAYGLPPLFTVLGATTLNYVEYGKLKQVLNAATLALAASASLEVSHWRKWAVYSFAFLCMTAYATRGFMLVMMAQLFFVFCLGGRTSKRKLYYAALGTFLFAVIVSDIIGNGRAESTSEAFVAFFGITDTYSKWPMAMLWVLSYVSSPISNLCWIIHSYRYTQPSLTFLTSLVPAFWAPQAIESGYLGSPHIIDGVHTYLAKYYLDLWFYGIALINFVWGIIAALLTYRARLVRNVLTSAVLLAAIVFIFFADYLTFLSIVLELSVLAIVERYAVVPISAQRSMPAEA